MSEPRATRSTTVRRFGPLIGLPDDVGEAIDAMDTGTVLLSVPLVDEVIQIGAERTLTIGTIEVTKTPSTMTVRRTDGTPLQAEILHRPDRGAQVRMPAFSEPVDVLRLRRLPGADGSRRWAVCAGAPLRRIADLGQFVTTITAFGRAKQCRSQCCRDAAATA